MKKLLEVLQYGENEIRFNTEFDVHKNVETLPAIVLGAAMSMTTKLWGGNEMSVLAIIRALCIADLAVSVNRKDMIRQLDEESEAMAKMFFETMEAFRRGGGTLMTFGPGVFPSKTKS